MPRLGRNGQGDFPQRAGGVATYDVKTGELREVT